jgi:two-component system sensor histidine kinase QseC
VSAETPRRPSLTRHLLAWALGALVLVWGSFIVVGYRTGAHEADELTDGHLASVSSLLLPQAGAGLGANRVIEDVPNASMRAHDYQQSLSAFVWDAAGRLVSRTGDAPAPPFDVAEGFATLRLGQPAASWRAYTRWDAAHGHKLSVLLSVRERDELADDIAQQVVEPGLWLLPVVALVLGLAIHRGLKPLRVLSQQVHALDIHQAGGLKEAADHAELQATVEAINRLVERYHAALTRERALADELAHELRTPLASLALHADGARAAAPGPDRELALTRVQQEALRAGEVLSHLLALARASRAELDEAAQPVELHELAGRVVAQFAPAAQASGRDLARVGEGPFRVMGHPVLLELALRNLVENALAHTPPGTQVEVELVPAAGLLQVVDDGPARAAVARAPHGGVRPLRLGLGLKVVEKICAIHGARFEPGQMLEGARQAWRVVFPLSADEGAAGRLPPGPPART